MSLSGFKSTKMLRRAAKTNGQYAVAMITIIICFDCVILAMMDLYTWLITSLVRSPTRSTPGTGCCRCALPTHAPFSIPCLTGNHTWFSTPSVWLPCSHATSTPAAWMVTRCGLHTSAKTLHGKGVDLDLDLCCNSSRRHARVCGASQPWESLPCPPRVSASLRSIVLVRKANSQVVKVLISSIPELHCLKGPFFGRVYGRAGQAEPRRVEVLLA